MCVQLGLLRFHMDGADIYVTRSSLAAENQDRGTKLSQYLNVGLTVMCA